MIDQLSKGNPLPILNVETGDVQSRAQAEQEIVDLERTIPVLQNQIEQFKKGIGFWYKTRNWALGIGFVGLIVAKVLVPYFK